MAMQAQEIIDYISNSEKKTPVKIYIKEKAPIDYGSAKVFFEGESKVVFGDWGELKGILEKNRGSIADMVVENDRRHSGVALLDLKELESRVEPGAIIREKVQIGKKCVIMMGAIINIGSIVGDGTMIDMGAVLGGRAEVGKNCHIGANAVLAGVVEPASAKPVVVEDNVLIGANAVVIEGVRVGQNSVIAAGSIVIEDVPPNVVMGGVPARILKQKDDKTMEKTELVQSLRNM